MGPEDPPEILDHGYPLPPQIRLMVVKLMQPQDPAGLSSPQVYDFWKIQEEVVEVSLEAPEVAWIFLVSVPLPTSSAVHSFVDNIDSQRLRSPNVFPVHFHASKILPQLHFSYTSLLTYQGL